MKSDEKPTDYCEIYCYCKNQFYSASYDCGCVRLLKSRVSVSRETSILRDKNEQ